MYLQGKRAVVTGSGAGLGRAFAKGLAAAGASVLVNAKTPAHVDEVVAEIRADGGTAEGCPVDIRTMAGAGQLIETATKRFGGIDILVNNAGMTGRKLFLDMNEADFDEVIEVDLKGTFACTRHAAPYMVEQKWGRIINIASAAARGLYQYTAYAAAKGGILAMTSTLAQELGEFGITCNAVRATTITPSSRRVYEHYKQAALDRGEQPPAPVELGYFEPEQAAPIVVFLATEDAGWINGQFIGLDGPRLTLRCLTSPVSTAFMNGGWSVEDLRKYFKTTVGRQLEPINWRDNFAVM